MAIEPELLKSETGAVAARQRSGTVTGWDLVARGCWYFHQVTQPTHLHARELFRQAHQVDPDLPVARDGFDRPDGAARWTNGPDRHTRGDSGPS